MQQAVLSVQLCLITLLSQSSPEKGAVRMRGKALAGLGIAVLGSQPFGRPGGAE